MNEHPWLVIAPWFNWPKRSSVEFGTARDTGPTFHKFTRDVYVDRFVATPQGSFEFADTDALGRDRKLFLATHDRLYLVACEVVCDTQGFPAPAPDQICEAMFVIRRTSGTATEWWSSARRWVPLAGSGADLQDGEETHPLFPLDGSADGHDAGGRSMYFGAMPTYSAVHDDADRPQFDSTHAYTVRMFVRRHDPCCPRRTGRRDCHGPMVASRPSDPYRLAAPFDPVGCGQHQVTVPMPNINDFKDRAVRNSVRFVSSAGSSASVPLKDGVPPIVEMSLNKEAEVCFYAIPLITLVAKFVMSIFTGIVLFVFQAWWMLRLQFCLGGDEGVADDLQTVTKQVRVALEAFESGDPPNFDLDVATKGQLIDLLIEACRAAGFHPDQLVPPPVGGKRNVTEAVLALRGFLASTTSSGSPRPLVPGFDTLTLRARVERLDVGLT